MSGDFVLDPSSESFSYDPYPTFAWMREHEPVYHWTKGDLWIVTRFEDLRTVLTDPRLSTDSHEWEHHPGSAMFEQPGFEAWARLAQKSFFGLPPKEHMRIRKLASAALTPRAVRGMDERITATIEHTLEQCVAAGREVVNIRDFAEPIPLAIICDLLGIPQAQRADFRRFGRAALRSVLPNRDPEHLAQIAHAFTQGVALLDALIEERRDDRDPPPDLLTALIQASDDPKRLSNDELVNVVFALIVGGSDTTVHGTCFAVRSLLRHRKALAELQADRSLLRGAVEETLRWDHFLRFGIYRYAREDLVLTGRPIRKGQAVVGAIAAAQRDPLAFDEPERFDIRREYHRNLTFGFGSHFCLGVNLARSELTRAVEILLLDRFPEAELAGDHCIDLENPVARAILELPVRLGPDHGPRRGVPA